MIFSQSTGGNVSDEDAMSCDDETPVMPPVALRPSSSGQTLQGAVQHQLLTQQPSLTLLPLLTPQTPQTSSPHRTDFCVGKVVCGGSFLTESDCCPHAPYSNSLY